jgi:transposase InsO family protein
VDVFSGFPFLFGCRSALAAAVLSAAQEVFLQTGLSWVLLTDRGSAFMAGNFQEFLQKCQVRHRVSTPQFSQSNGAAGRAVRTLKTLRAKSNTVYDLFQAVLEFQNTPRAPQCCQKSGIPDENPVNG